MNFFNLMLRKRLRKEEDGEEDGDLLDSEKGKKPSKKKEKGLKISEMDDWMDSDDEDEAESNEDEKKSDDEAEAKKKKKGSYI